MAVEVRQGKGLGHTARGFGAWAWAARILRRRLAGGGGFWPPEAGPCLISHRAFMNGVEVSMLFMTRRLFGLPRGGYKFVMDRRFWISYGC